MKNQENVIPASPPNPRGWRKQESSKYNNFLPEVDPPLAEYIPIFTGFTEKGIYHRISIDLKIFFNPAKNLFLFSNKITDNG